MQNAQLFCCVSFGCNACVRTVLVHTCLCRLCKRANQRHYLNRSTPSALTIFCGAHMQVATAPDRLPLEAASHRTNHRHGPFARLDRRHRGLHQVTRKRAHLHRRAPFRDVPPQSSLAAWKPNNRRPCRQHTRSEGPHFRASNPKVFHGARNPPHSFCRTRRHRFRRFTFIRFWWVKTAKARVCSETLMQC